MQGPVNIQNIPTSIAFSRTGGRYQDLRALRPYNDMLCILTNTMYKNLLQSLQNDTVLQKCLDEKHPVKDH